MQTSHDAVEAVALAKAADANVFCTVAAVASAPPSKKRTKLSPVKLPITESAAHDQGSNKPARHH